MQASGQPGTTAPPSAGLRRGFHWIGVVFVASLLVLIPICAVLVAEAHFANKEMQAQAAKSLDTLARLTSDWVAAKVDHQQRRRCSCEAAHRGVPPNPFGRPYCFVERAPTPEAPRERSAAKVWLEGGSLLMKTQSEDCVAQPVPGDMAYPLERADANVQHTTASAGQSSSHCQAHDALCNAECAANDAGVKCERVPLEDLRRLLEDHLRATNVLHNVVLETVTIDNEHRTPILRAGDELVAREASKAGWPLQSLSTSSQPPDVSRRVDFDGIEPAVPWRLRGVCLHDPWSSIGTRNLFAFILVATLLVLTWPAFKVAFMSPVERITRLNVFHLLVAIPIAIAVAVVYLQAALTTKELRALEDARLATAAFQARQELVDTLSSLAHETRGAASLLHGQFSAAHSPPIGKRKATAANLDSAQLDPTTTAALSTLRGQRKLQTLPFDLVPNHVSGLAPDGMQLVKVGLTPLDEKLVETRPARLSAMSNYVDRPYFRHAKDTDEQQQVFVQFLRSRGNERYLLVLANKPNHSPTPPVEATTEPAVWATSFRLATPADRVGNLFEAPSYALIDSTGNVLAHTEPDRVMSENFFSSTNTEQELRLWVRQNPTQSRGFTFDYYGKATQAVIQPITWQAQEELVAVGDRGREQWFVVAFEPGSMVEAVGTDLLAVGLLAAGFLLLVRIALAGFCALAFGGKAEWWWPGSESDLSRRARFIAAIPLQLCVIIAAICLPWDRLPLVPLLVVVTMLLVISLLGARALLSPPHACASITDHVLSLYVSVAACIWASGSAVAVLLGVEVIFVLGAWVVLGILSVLAYWYVHRIRYNFFEPSKTKTQGGDGPRSERGPASVRTVKPNRLEQWIGSALPHTLVYWAFVGISAAVPVVIVRQAVAYVYEVETRVAYHGQAQTEGEQAPTEDEQATSEDEDVALVKVGEASWSTQLVSLLSFRNPTISAIRWCAHALERAKGSSPDDVRVRAACDSSVTRPSQAVPVDDERSRVAGASPRLSAVASVTASDPVRVFPRETESIVGWTVVIVLSLLLLGTLSRRVFGVGIVKHTTPLLSANRLQSAKPEERAPASVRAEPDGQNCTDAPRVQIPRRRLLIRHDHTLLPPKPDFFKSAFLDLGRGAKDFQDQLSTLERSNASGFEVTFGSCELALGDSELRQLLLHALELVAAREGWNAILIAERELFSALLERESEFLASPIDDGTRLKPGEVLRWAKVLSLCDFQEPAAGEGADTAELPAYIRNELAWDPTLKQLGSSVNKQLKRSGHDQGEESDMLNAILAFVTPRHRYLWGTCTDHEKLLLIQLAAEGFINPHRWDMAQALCRRGLLEFGPNFRIRAKSFELFVRRAVPPQALHEWEHGSETGQWQRISTGMGLLLIAIFGVLAWGFPDLNHGRVGVALTTLVGWIVMLQRLKLFNMPEPLASILPRS